MIDAMGAVAGTVAISILVGIGVGTTAFLIGKNVGESEAYDFMFKRLGGDTYRLGRDRPVEQVKETPDERLQTALTELMVAMEQAHCTDHDAWYCDHECPAKTGSDECVWSKCYGLCEELGMLPTGSDGRPVKVGESVCDPHGNMWRVASLTIGGDVTYANCYAVGRCDGAQINPKTLTHEFKSIPDLMLAFAREYASCSDSASVKRALDNYVARMEACRWNPRLHGGRPLPLQMRWWRRLTGLPTDKAGNPSTYGRQLRGLAARRSGYGHYSYASDSTGEEKRHGID